MTARPPAGGSSLLHTALALVALLVLVSACSPDTGDSVAEDGAPAAGDDGESVIVTGVADLVEQVEPSVVSVLFAAGGGSGVVWDDEGRIVTNAHVALAAGGGELTVAFADGSQAPAELVAADERTDVAVLMVDGEHELPPATFRQELPRVGEAAVAIGSPLGLENSVTAGVISGLDRSIPGAAEAGIPALTGLLQTDAALSPGSSGGALIDGSGAVVGINVAFIPPQMQAVSIGFAIPTATVVDVVDQLLTDGAVAHPFMGVQLAPLTPETRDELGVDADRGAIILAAPSEAPAAEAGLEAGDVIVRVGDDEVREPGDLLVALRGYAPGDVVEVEVARDDARLTVEVTLGERPQEDVDIQPPPGGMPDQPDELPTPGSPEDLPEAPLPPGGEIPVPEPGSSPAGAGDLATVS